MHHIYTTPAFVIHSSPHGEAGKFLLLFTKDFGMIGAVAQGVRLSQSKLKYHLQDFNLTNVSIVRGKEVWRVTGANEIESKKPSIVHLKILKLLRRLLHGEEKNEELFKIIEVLYQIEIKEEDSDATEILTVLRILSNLGYVRGNEGLNPFLENNQTNNQILEEVRKNKSEIVKTINQALSESQL